MPESTVPGITAVPVVDDVLDIAKNHISNGYSYRSFRRHPQAKVSMRLGAVLLVC